MPQNLSISPPLVEQMTTGILLVAAASLISRQTSNPLQPGNTTSKMMMSGFWLLILVKASSPLLAVKTLRPPCCKQRVRTCISVKESSTTRAVLTIFTSLTNEKNGYWLLVNSYWLVINRQITNKPQLLTNRTLF